MNIDIDTLVSMAGAIGADFEHKQVIYRFSPSTGGFYPDDGNYPNLPGDLIELSHAEYDALIARDSNTKLEVQNGKVVIVPADPPPAWTVEQARAHRDFLLSSASVRIAPLQDAADLDEATAAEAVSLKAWKQYRVALNRIEQQPGFPADVAWPVAPT